jgi:hypothetical protein
MLSILFIGYEFAKHVNSNSFGAERTWGLCSYCQPSVDETTVDDCDPGLKNTLREKLEEWRGYYEEDRPRGSIGRDVLMVLQNPSDVISPSP